MMASTSRPTLRSSSGRLAGPAGEQHVHDMAASHHSPASATPHMSSRHSLPSKAFPRPSQLDALPSDAHLTNAKSSLVSPQRKLSRKRKAVSISDDADVSLASLKPPTRFSVARSHGRSLEPVNGVQRPSDINEDRKSPAASSPKAASTSSSNVAVNGVTFKEPNNARVASRSTRGAVLGEEKRGNVDKRTLRSQDGGSRLKSDLATYFANYDDVITDAPQEPGRYAHWISCKDGQANCFARVHRIGYTNSHRWRQLKGSKVAFRHCSSPVRQIKIKNTCLERRCLFKNTVKLPYLHQDKQQHHQVILHLVSSHRLLLHKPQY